MKRSTNILLVAIAVLLIVASQGFATTWNPAVDITATTITNPAGPWSFGYLDLGDGTFSLYSHYYADAATPGPGKPIHCWDYVDPAGSWRGFVTKNASTVTQTHYALAIPAGGIAFHPGWLNADQSGEARAVIRWTSPISGGVKIDATFTARSLANADVYVRQKGTIQRFSGLCVDTTPVVTPSIYAAVAPGDTIDFEVGWAGQCWSDYTGIDLTIQDGIATGRIAGTVTSQFPGNPGIPDATLSVTDAVGTVTILTDASGGYAFDLLPGTYSVQASSPGYVTSDAVDVTVSAEATATQNFSLVGGRIEGTVTSSLNGLPVEGASVVAGDYSFTTGADGHYSIVCPPDQYFVTASKAGYESDGTDVTVTSGVLSTQNFVLSAGEIQGRVTANGSGNPILGAKIVLGDYFAVTDANGDYELLLPPGDMTAVCRAGGYVQASQPVTISSTGTVTKNFALDVATSVDLAADFNTYANPTGAWSFGQTSTIGGAFSLLENWATKGTDNGLVGQESPAQVIFNPTGVDDHWMFQDTIYVADFEAGKVVLWPAYTGEKAVARFTVLAPGKYLVSSSFKGRYGAGDGTTTNAYLLSNNTLMVSGQVRGFSGTSAMGYADAYGSGVLLSGLLDLAANDTIDFVVDDGGDGYATDGTQLDVTIAPFTGAYGTLQGYVTNCADSAGIAGAWVRAYSYSDGAYYGVITDANGSYSLELPEGSYDIEISKIGYQMPVYDYAYISSGATTTVDACLTGTVIVGHVRFESASGPGMAGVTVKTDDETYLAITDDSGAYELPVVEGTYNLIASKAGYESQEADGIVVENGQRVTADFILTPGVYDVAADFDQTMAGNPSGVWSYGRKQTATGTFYLNDAAVPNAFYGRDYGNGMIGWVGFVDQYLTAKCVYNTATAAFDWEHFNSNVEPGRFYMGPGSDDMKSVARWTAPGAGWVQVDATFSGREFLSGTTSDVYVIRDSETLLSADLIGFSGSTLPEPARAAFGSAPTQTYSGIVGVAVGSTIDFIVGTGPDGWTTDFAELAATLHYTEQPVVNCDRIDEARALADGTPVSVKQAKVVTVAPGAFTDATRYVEEPARTSGIKVVFTSGSAALGDAITFSGVVKTDANGEKYIDISSVDSKTASTVPGDLGMTNKTAVGSQAQGLLVTIWGTITERDASQMVIDDGSGIGVRVQLNGLASPVVKQLAINKVVSVTGPMGLFSGAPNVRPRGDADVVLHN